jgi:hypothetical protein
VAHISEKNTNAQFVVKSSLQEESSDNDAVGKNRSKKIK